MITASKSTKTSRWTWDGKRFTRQKPSQRTQQVCKGVQLYHRARYYDPITGEFISQDPLEYVDGMSLYRGYFLPNGKDPFGMECKVCGQRVHFRGHAEHLDFPVQGTPYQRGLDAWVAEWKRKSKHNGGIFGGLEVPRILKAGPRLFTAPKSDLGPGFPKKGSYGISVYPFFVDFDVCNPDDCKVEVIEHGEQRDYDGVEWTEWKTTKGPNALALFSPPWAANLSLNKKLFLFNPCTHRIVFTDAPGIEQFIKKNTKKENRIDSPINISQIRANQRVIVKDKTTGKIVAEVDHDFLIGLDENGELVHQP